MQLQVQRPVDPRDPDQGEDDGELGQPADRDMLGQVMGRLADDGHIHQVVEQLQDADLPVGDDLAMGSRRPPEPPLEAAVGLAGHGISRPPRLAGVCPSTREGGSHRAAPLDAPDRGRGDHAAAEFAAGWSAARPRLASCAGHWRMRTPAGANETWWAASTVSTQQLQPRFRTTDGRPSVVPAPMRGMAMTESPPTSRRARRRGRGRHHPSLPGQLPRRGPGRAAPAHRGDQVARTRDSRR